MEWYEVFWSIIFIFLFAVTLWSAGHAKCCDKFPECDCVMMEGH